MNDIDTKVIALIQESVDNQLGPRRPAPPFRPGQPANPAGNRREPFKAWLIPMLAAAVIVGVITATIGLTQLTSARTPVRRLATTASPLATSAPANPSSSATSSRTTPASTASETTAGSPSSSELVRGPSFAGVAGYYFGSTASSGQLFIRADGASRFTEPNYAACPKCSTATAPLETIDFSLTALIPLTGPGSYRAEGIITAGSDPADAIKQAGPVGSKVSATIGADGSLRLSFISPYDILHKAP